MIKRDLLDLKSIKHLKEMINKKIQKDLQKLKI